MNADVWQARCEGIDQILSVGRFGDARFLQANTKVLYDGLRDVLARWIGERLPRLRGSLPLTSRMVLRRTYDDAYAALTEKGVDAASAKVSEFLSVSDGARAGEQTPMEDMVLLSRWQDDPFARSIADTFTTLMARDGIRVEVVAPEQGHIDCLKQARRLLDRLLPKTTRNTLPLARCVVLMKGDISSAYLNENPYGFHVNVDQLGDPLLAADVLLHEALHQKLADIRLTSNQLNAGYDDFTSEARVDVPIPWPDADQPRPFSVARGLATLHVYVHLTVLYAAALAAWRRKQDVGGVDLETIARRLTRVYERARYLIWALSRETVKPYLGPDADELLAWLHHPVETFGALRLPGGALEAAAADWRAHEAHAKPVAN